jgi:hypothetical protein
MTDVAKQVICFVTSAIVFHKTMNEDTKIGYNLNIQNGNTW